VVAGRVLEDGDVAIMMVEAEATEATWRLVQEGAQPPTEEIVAEGLEASKSFIKTLCVAQSELAELAAKPKTEFPLFVDYEQDAFEAVERTIRAELSEAITIAGKADREARLEELKAQVLER